MANIQHIVIIIQLEKNRRVNNILIYVGTLSIETWNFDNLFTIR